MTETHRHLSIVVLPGGTGLAGGTGLLGETVLPGETVLTAASFDPAAPYARAREPDYGLYLDPRWQPPWVHDLLGWPDFGVPGDAGAARAALADVLARARRGQRVEVGCLGGHGRTGTALACLAVLAGYPACDAVAWVRSAYCAQAVETPAQEAFAAAFGQLLAPARAVTFLLLGGVVSDRLPRHVVLVCSSVLAGLSQLDGVLIVG